MRSDITARPFRTTSLPGRRTGPWSALGGTPGRRATGAFDCFADWRPDTPWAPAYRSRARQKRPR